MLSPHFRSILGLTRGRKKPPDVKSFSHELNSKGVRPFPVWKSRAWGHMEEVMLAIREKFNRLKDEVDSDLGIFAGDLVGILENISNSHPEWEETLQDLLVTALQCAKMPPSEFWLKCEGIVQTLDDRRQELPIGFLKQSHTHILFILTRCTRLVQFQKESGYEENHILGFHQFSDLGVYHDQILEIAQQDFSGPLVAWNTANEKLKKRTHHPEHDPLTEKQDHIGKTIEVGTARSVDSSTSSYKMSSWKKFPSAPQRNSNDHSAIDVSLKEKTEVLQQIKNETGTDGEVNSENAATPQDHSSSGIKKVSWGLLEEKNNISYDNSMICRICEVEIPIAHVQEHSLICTIVDRCDLKGLTVNERLKRVAETLEKILQSWTPKSSCTSRGSVEAERSTLSSVHEDFNQLSPTKTFHHQCSEDISDANADNAFSMDHLSDLPPFLCDLHSSTNDGDGKTFSTGSLTPKSPLSIARDSEIELLLNGWRTTTELENYQQINRLLDIARSIASADGSGYSALDCLLDCLEDLKYSIHDKKVDALIVETFGRRIEKLLQEKYVHLCAQIDDEKSDSCKQMVDEDSSVEYDTYRYLHASSVNLHCKDRTSIEDFEIIKPISRGAFGRVFLAKKRATGDLFAIKVLKKADMIRKNAVQSILVERNILISLRNPFVVRFFFSFTCRENLYLVMEYLNGGDLYSLLRNLGCLDENMARIYAAEVVLALEYLHSLNVIHRDLKPDNLLVGQDGHLKLTDFGLSNVGLINSTDDFSGSSISSFCFLHDDEPKGKPPMMRERQNRTMVGTPDYLAPEILLGLGHGSTADWWSLGIILFELLVGVPPFNAETPQQVFDNIINREVPWPRVPEDMTAEACDLIDKLLMENPAQRLGAIGAVEVKQHPFFRDINWDTLARQKAMFVPSAEAQDTSYFTSRYVGNPNEEDDLRDYTSVSDSLSNTMDEDGDECGSLADFPAPLNAADYSFSNFSFKNLAQLACINYDLVGKSTHQGG